MLSQCKKDSVWNEHVQMKCCIAFVYFDLVASKIRIDSTIVDC